MSTAFNLSGLGYANLNGSIVALQGISYSPNLGREPFRSGGDLNPSMMRRAGSRPAFRLTMPLSSAWGALGQFLPVNLSAFTMYEAAFSGTPALRIGTGATTLGLTAITGLAYGMISRIYPTGGAVPLVLADVTVVLCATDGLTDPVTLGSSSLPSGANPILHTLGPLVDNATARWGVRSWTLDTGIGLEAIQNDGLFYPTTYRLGAVQAIANVAHNDVVTLHAAITDSGKDATGAGFILYARAYDAASKTLQATGYSFTLANAMASIESSGAQGTDRAEMALQLASYAAANALTYPITVSTSATLPT
ncbi:MAG: hypothetical protein KGN77_05180 [Xanthomonadaceae bacterium]|nr:hypothetical protein [Xanthomonadaceae bacterium]